MPAPVDTLAEVAAELVVRVRDCGPDDNAAWLLERLPDPGDWFRLAFMCAAAVPDDRSWNQLVAWAREGRTPTPAVDKPERGKATAAAIDKYLHLPPPVIARRTGLEKSTVYRHLKRMRTEAEEEVAA